MTRYIQRVSLLGKDKWLGWEVDGLGTEVPGLTLADEMTSAELEERGVTEFRRMSFEQFLSMTAAMKSGNSEILDEDIDFRLDALQVGMDRFRAQGVTDVPLWVLIDVLGGAMQIEHPRVQDRFYEWQAVGAIELVGRADCYLRITGRLA